MRWQAALQVQHFLRQEIVWETAQSGSYMWHRLVGVLQQVAVSL